MSDLARSRQKPGHHIPLCGLSLRPFVSNAALRALGQLEARGRLAFDKALHHHPLRPRMHDAGRLPNGVRGESGNEILGLRLEGAGRRSYRRRRRTRGPDKAVRPASVILMRVVSMACPAVITRSVVAVAKRWPTNSAMSLSRKP